MTVTPVILGSGRSGDALAKSFAILSVMRPELNIAPAVRLERGTSLKGPAEKYSNPILCIANPHGLHAEAILEADLAGYKGIIAEKPACVNLEQLKSLRGVKTPTAVLHVYRQMWGLQTIKKMIEEKRFGQIISVEGRYWQASTAERALQTTPASNWKDDTRLSGEFDVYLDIATHWVDSANFLLGSLPNTINGWRSYINANSPHRDSHVQLTMDYPTSRAFASISKTFHGATNHFEMNIIGSHLSATWNFLNPDEIIIGEGRDKKTMTRKESHLGSQLPPFHGMGWVEGYIEITSRLLDEVVLKKKSSYPHLKDNLDMLESMLQIKWNN